MTLILQKGKFLLILLFKRVLKSSYNLPRNGKTITKSFFPAVNVTGFSVSLLLRKFFMQLSINLIGNSFFFNISFKWNTSESNLEKSQTTENVRNNKVKSKPTLYSLEMKLLKFESTPLNMGLWYTDVLKPLHVLVIKTSKKGMELFCSFSQMNLPFLCLEFKYFLNFSRWSGDKTKQICHQHYDIHDKYVIFCSMQVWIHQDIH